MTPVIDGLAVRSRLIVIGVYAEPIQVLSLQLIGASRSIGVTLPARRLIRASHIPAGVSRLLSGNECPRNQAG